MTDELERLLRPELAAMPAYEPIEPIDELARKLGIAPERIIKLDGNENPYGPSPRVREALATFPYYHIYPDPGQREARRALAGYVGVSPEQIVLGTGSDEVMDLVLRAFVRPGEGVINCPPTFGMYPFLTHVLGAEVIDVLRRDDFSLDLPGIEQAAARAKVIFVAAPNNPTGNPISKAEVDALLATGLVVVLDEAYVEFAAESFVQKIGHSNLIVLRTFSKWAGLAGLRVGYGVMPETIAATLMKIKQPYNLNQAAQAALLASLEDIDLLQERVRLLIEERGRLFDALATISWLSPLPSQANFILSRLNKNVDALEVQSELRKGGIMVRHFDAPPLRNYLRISVGLPEHREALLKALQEIGGRLG